MQKKTIFFMEYVTQAIDVNVNLIKKWFVEGIVTCTKDVCKYNYGF